MNGDALNAWIGVVGVGVGAVFALAGVGLSELGHWIRAKRAEKAASAARTEDRRTELWQISLPAASRVQDHFATTLHVARGSSPYDSPSFEDTFPDWWEEREPNVRRDIALIPSIVFREAFTTIIERINFRFQFGATVDHASGYRFEVKWLAGIGFDIASAWMRDEPSIDQNTQHLVNELRENLQAMGDG